MSQAQEDFKSARSHAYPRWGEQFDLLFKAIDADAELKAKFSAFHSAIDAVKKANPKP